MSDTINTSTVTKIVLGGVMTILTGGGIWWMSSIYTHLASIDAHIIQLAKFQGGVEQFMKTTNSRLTTLEDHHQR